MTHPLATFDLQILRPVHSATQRLCGYVVRIKGLRVVHFVMLLEDCSELRRFRKFLLEQGSFHFWMNERDLADFLTRCFNASESPDSVTLEDAIAEVEGLNVQPELAAMALTVNDPQGRGNVLALATRGLEPAPEKHAGDGQPLGLPSPAWFCL